MQHHIALLVFALIFCLASTHGQRKGNTRHDEESEEAKRESNYYSIYEAIDTLTTHTSFSTFYELLGVAPEAPTDEVSRAFRKKSLQYHPDKMKLSGEWDETMEKMSKLVQFVGSLLRDEQGRRDYDWILNEAPAWHRQATYVFKKFKPTAKVTPKQVILIVIGFSLLVQLIGQWSMYAYHRYVIFSSQRELKAMGEKEVKKLRRRMETTDDAKVAFLAYNNSAYYSVLLADAPPPPVPTPLDLWPFAIPRFFFRMLFARKESVVKVD